MEIIVRRVEKKWVAQVGDKTVVSSPCKPCVVKALIAVTKDSIKYDKIVIHNEDGTPMETILTGANRGR